MNKYRVIFKKNLGLGKRLRLNHETSDLIKLTEWVEITSKEERYRPMRAYLLDDNDKALEQYVIKINHIGECEITTKQPRRKSSEVKKEAAEKREIKVKATKVIKPSDTIKVQNKKPLTAKELAMRDMERTGMLDTDDSDDVKMYNPYKSDNYIF